MASNKRKRDGLDDAPGLARITYHADTRAFERLFKERSLEELKDSVRRKLGLASGVVVRLKQVRSNMLLDLDDDDDFEALRAQALDDTLSTIDIKVTVEERNSQPPTTEADDQPQPSTLSATHPAPTTKKRRITSGKGAPTSTPQVAISGTPETTEPPKQPVKPESKKRKTVSKDTTMVASAAPALPQKETEAPSPAPKANSASKGVDEPPKKKPKKTVSAPNGESSKADELSKAGESSKSSEVLKANDGILDKTKETGKSVDGGSAEAAPTPTPKKKPLKSSKSKDQGGRESEAATGGLVRGEEQPPKSSKPKEGTKQSTVKVNAKAPKVAKKSEKSKKAATREAPEPSVAKDDSRAAPVIAPQTNDRGDGESAGIASSLAPKKSSKKKSTYQGGVSQPEKQRGSNNKISQLMDECTVKDGSAASNPTLLDAESWGDFLESFKLEIAQLQNEKDDSPAQDEASKKSKEPKRVKKCTVPPTQEPTPPISTEPSPPDDRDTPSSGEEMQSPSTGHPCPVCLEWPFHVRYNCSIVRQGSDAIQKRLDELRESDACDNEHLIEELEGLLQRCKGSDKALTAASEPPPPPPASAPSTNAAVLPLESSMSVDSSLASTPLPSGEESSPATSSDEDEESETERAMSPPKPSRTNKKVVFGEDVLEAVMRGPAPKLGIPSILRELREEEERESVELEEEEEEGRGERSRERLPHLEARSSEEDDEDDSRPPSAAATGNRSLRYVGLSNGSEETRLGRKLAGDVVADPLKVAPDIPAVSKKVAFGKTKDSAKNLSNGSCEHGADSDDVVDPIEPAEELAYPSDSYFPEADPIEPGTPTFNKVEKTNHSTPKASSSRWTKTQGGIVPADDVEHPVPGSSIGRDMVIPLPEGRKPRKKAVGFSASQEVVGTRRLHSPEPLPSTVPTSAAENDKGKATVRGGKVPKTPAKVPQKTLKMNGTTKKVGAARTPSPAMWETIPDATSSVQLDELLSSSSQVEGNTLTPVVGKPSDTATSNPGGDSHGEHDKKERLFDLTASQIPFPYSQYTTPKAPAPASSSDSDTEQEEAHKQPSENHVRKSTTRAYRSLTELASEASTLFSPSLPTPKATAGNRNGQKRVEGDDSDASSSSSESDHATTSTHIPRGRRASSVLPTRKKRGLLAGL